MANLPTKYVRRWPVGPMFWVGMHMLWPLCGVRLRASHVTVVLSAYAQGHVTHNDLLLVQLLDPW